MKARVKETGEIVEVAKDGPFYNVIDGYERYYEHELDFQDALDYWEKLKHQYAGMVLQGLLSNSAYLADFAKYNVEGEHLAKVVSRNAIDYATALVNKLKEEEK